MAVRRTIRRKTKKVHYYEDENFHFQTSLPEDDDRAFKNGVPR